MIRAFIFDMDGTLIKTEQLKARSYARAAVELCPHDISEEDVLEAFKEVVGRPRREVATYLVEQFDLADKASDRMDEFGVDTPWQAYVQVRLNYYEDMINDPDTLRENLWSYTHEVLEIARQRDYQIALATMSTCKQANHVLDALDLADAFDFVATSDDVENGKPDPEIYQLVLAELGRLPAECIVLEDSPSGVEAALAADLNVIALGTPFTRQRLHEANMLSDEWIVDKSARLPEAVQRCFAIHNDS